MGRANIDSSTGYLQEKIRRAEKKKKELASFVEALRLKEQKKEISAHEFKIILDRELQGKSLQYWDIYYDAYIKNCRELIEKEDSDRKRNKKVLIFCAAIFSIGILIGIIFSAYFLINEKAQEAEVSPSQEPSFIRSITGFFAKTFGIIGKAVEESAGEEIPEPVPKALSQEQTQAPAPETPASQESSPSPSGTKTEEEAQTTEVSPSQKLPLPSESTAEEIGEETEKEKTSEKTSKPEIKEAEKTGADETGLEEGQVQEEIPEIVPENITAPEEIPKISEIIPEPAPETIPEEIPEIIPEKITETNATLTENAGIANASISTIQHQAVIGVPVKWEKHISLETPGIVKVKLPKEAENIIVNKIVEATGEKPSPLEEPPFPSYQEKTTEQVSLSPETSALIESIESLRKEISSLRNDITGLREEIAGLKQEISELKKTQFGQEETAPGQVEQGAEKEIEQKMQELEKKEEELREAELEKTENETHVQEKKEEETGEAETENSAESVQEPAEEEAQEPEQAEKIKETAKATITGGAISEHSWDSFASSILNFFKNILIRLFSALTGRAIAEIPAQELETKQFAEEIEITIDDTATEYEIIYETPAAQIAEQEISDARKIITISGPDNPHYQNVMAYTSLPKETEAEKVHLYHLTSQGKQGEANYITNEGRREVDVNKIDEDSDGLIDKIEWIVLSLSNQTYELIIEITKAEHLDENRSAISDIYESVRELDEFWSEEIPDSHYVRVVFESELDSSRDITIYPRITSGNPAIEVYEANSNHLIAEFTNLQGNSYNKVYLANLQGTQDTFDLRVAGGAVEINHIIDPNTGRDGPDGNSAGTNVCDTPTAAYTDDGSYSSCDKGKDHYWLYNSFNIPVRATITGIQVECKDCYIESGKPEDFEVQVSCNAGTTYSSYVDYPAITATAAPGNTVSNGADGTTMWGLTCNYSDFNINSRVIIHAIQQATTGNEGKVYMDWLPMTVYYVSDTEYPIFNNYWSNNGTLSNSGIALFNTTLLSTNGTVLIGINGVNYSTKNLTSNVYNASVSLTSPKIYSYYWLSWGNGTLKNYNVSAIMYYTVINDTAPAVTLNSPASGANFTSTSRVFNCSALDTISLVNVTLYGNWSATGWHVNETNSSGINNTDYLFTKTISTNGNYIWNCLACDSLGQCAFASANRTFLIDTIPPSIVTSLQNASSGMNWIYWNWTEPIDADFNESVIYIDSVWRANTTDNYYNATGLAGSTEYTITIHTKDLYGNVNNTDVNDTGATLGDTAPPQINITSPLNQTYTATSIGFNVSSDETLGFCKFTLNNWATNYTMTLNSTSTGANYINSTMIDNSYTARFWCNDTSNNINDSESVIFSVNLPPRVSIDLISPTTSQVNATQYEFFNVTLNISCYDSNCSEVNVSLDPTNWWNTDWGQRKEINITSAVSSVLANFPMYLNVSKDADMQADFDDLRFINGSCTSAETLELNYEIENYTGENAHIWIKFPNLLAGINPICMYYGNSGAGKGENPAGVWNDKYKGVWHLAQSCSSNKCVKDSTQYANNGTPYRNTSTTDVLTNFYNLTDTGKIDGFYNFKRVKDINGDFVNNSDVVNDISGSVTGTFSAWLFLLTSAMKQKLVTVGDENLDSYLQMDITSTGKLSGQSRNASTCKVWSVETTGAMNTGTWMHVALVHNGTAPTLYLNGERVAQAITYPDIATCGGNDYTWFDDIPLLDAARIGGHIKNNEGEHDFLNGSLDEVRINNATETLDWINQSYQIVQNQNTFVVFAGEEGYRKGLVSTATGNTPFYTNNSNPRNISLAKDESQIVVFWVNATGATGTTSEFFAYTNVTSNMSITNITSVWNVTTLAADTIYPSFSDYWDNNGSLSGSGIGLFNATIANTNGNVFLEINGANYSAETLVSGVYNASVNLNSAGNYPYYWLSWGNGSSNRYNISAVRYYTVNATLNNAPRIVWAGNDSINAASGLNEGPSATGININFTAYDADGATNLNDATAQINFTKAGEALRRNITCTHLADYGTYYANYSCTITMWWWDASGNWNITAYVEDSSAASAQNTTTDFYVGETTGFSLSPGNLTWASLSPGTTNQTPTSGAIILNNTGNKDIAVGNILFNATHIRGETITTQAIWAGNMSASWDGAGANECDLGIATALNKTGGLWAGIPTANLTAGNYTANDLVTGQEEVSLCILQVGADLSTQQYSTAVDGAWTIQILVAVFAVRARSRQKKKRKLAENDRLAGALKLIAEELGEKYSLNKMEIAEIVINQLKDKHNLSRQEILELTGIKDYAIPASIFSSKIGALESVVKYMKENLGMKYSTIAKTLGRNDRTIWTAYNKACGKIKKKFEVAGEGIKIPLSAYCRKNLTVLESTIIYLRNAGMRCSEIARLLGRDQRNIWAICSRAREKEKMSRK